MDNIHAVQVAEAFSDTANLVRNSNIINSISIRTKKNKAAHTMKYTSTLSLS